MANYVAWYRKEITANNLKSAVQKEPKIKASFHSLEEIKEPELTQGTCAIGFEYYPPED